jgi:hypothetical protein
MEGKKIQCTVTSTDNLMPVVDAPEYLCGFYFDNQTFPYGTTAHFVTVTAVIVLLIPRVYTSCSAMFHPISKPVSRFDAILRRLRSTLPACSILCVILTSIATGLFVKLLAITCEEDSMNLEWSFGQVVAVFVWLPTLLSVVNDCVVGSIRGRTSQLPKTLRVVRADSGMGSMPAQKLGDDGDGDGGCKGLSAPVATTALLLRRAPSEEVEHA